MNILMAASEMAPFVRTGALADSVSELATELQKLGNQVSVVIPYYRAVREAKVGRIRKTGVKFSVPVGPGRYSCEIFETKSPTGVQVFLVARDEYFDRSGLYGTDDRDYQDNAARFIFFTKCALELARRMEPELDILHTHSWETAVAPVLAKDQRLPFRTVLTPHALEYQGNFWSFDFGLTNLPGEYFSARGVEYFGSLNCLKGGLLYADAVIFPSERAAAASQTPAYGCGLDAVLRELQHKLAGIPGSANLEGWDPAQDEALAATFSRKNPAPRARNRAALWQALGQTGEPRKRLYLARTEASSGAGIDLLLESLDRLLASEASVVLAGPVPSAQTQALEVARRKHQGRFVYAAELEDRASRLALAAADFLLVPGPVEPQTTWLRRAIRYGAVPIALQCPGLFQLVRGWEPGRETGNGFVFQAATADALSDMCRFAGRVLQDPATAQLLLARGLETDFSPEAEARGHVALYERLLGGQARKAA